MNYTENFMSIDQDYFVGQSIDMLQLIYFPLPSLTDFCVTPVNAIGYFTRRKACFSIHLHFLLGQIIVYLETSAADEKVRCFSFTHRKVPAFLAVFQGLWLPNTDYNEAYLFWFMYVAFHTLSKNIVQQRTTHKNNESLLFLVGRFQKSRA